MQNSEVKIIDVARADRERLEPILEDGFTGIYLWHARKTLKDVEIVKAATVGNDPAGLVMLRDLGGSLGYVYYIAVAKQFRQMGVGGILLDESLRYFFERGMVEVYASVESDNEASLKLFDSRGFRASSLHALTKKYGILKSNHLRMKMFLVPGELLRVKDISPKFEP